MGLARAPGGSRGRWHVAWLSARRLAACFITTDLRWRHCCGSCWPPRPPQAAWPPWDGRRTAAARLAPPPARCRGHCAEGARRPPRLRRSAPPAGRRRRRRAASAGQLKKGRCGALGAVWELGGSGRCLGQVGAGQLRRWKPLREFGGVGVAGAQVPESSGESPRGGACFLPQTFARLQEWF